MKAWLLDQISSIDSLRLGDVPDPVPREGEALLRVTCAALNPADRYLAEGQYPARPPFPHILGRDGIGVIEALGPGVDPRQHPVGQRRVVLRSEIGVNRAGTFAQHVGVPVESLAPQPAGWSDEQSAGAGLVYLTAYQALTIWGTPPPGGVVLVTGASGGVGVASLQLARAMGQTVVALSRNASKYETLREQGASIVMDPGDPRWRKQLKDRLAGTGAAGSRVDLAIDNIGGTLLPQVIDTLGENGKVSCVGRLAGPVPSFNTATLFFRRIRLGGVAVSAYRPEESRQVWDRVVDLLGRTGARPLVDSVWEFEQIQQAFARLAAGPMGKVLLKVE